MSRPDFDDLGPLETFDPRIFTSKDREEQAVSALMLAFALLHNDLRDIYTAQVMLLRAEDFGDKSEVDITPRAGQVSGVQVHITRLLASRMHELSRLIVKRSHIIQSACFERAIEGMEPVALESWRRVVAASTSAKDRTSDPMSQLIAFARDKLGAHYDIDEIWRGYRGAFLSHREMDPLLSRGAALANSRFYFVDAAAQMYLMDKVDEDTFTAFFTAGFPVMRDIHHALYEVVTAFMRLRGVVFRRADPKTIRVIRR